MFQKSNRESAVPAKTIRPEGHEFSSPHLQERAVDLTCVAEFLAAKGYEPENLQQQWRHVTGSVLDSSGERKFFKLASTPVIGERTQNELRWYERVGHDFRARSDGLVFCPAIYEHGFFEGRFFYVGEFVDGEPIPQLESMKADNDERYVRSLLPAIAQIAVFLTRYSDVQMWEVLAPRTHSELTTHWFSEAEIWLESARSRQAPEEMINQAFALKSGFRPALAHGDFSIGNIMPGSATCFALIDGEHAFSGWPIWYDVANMAHRLGTRGSADLAKMFCSAVRSGLSEDARVSFDSELLPVLSYCSLRGFHELAVDRQEEPALGKHLRFAQFLSSGSVTS